MSELKRWLIMQALRILSEQRGEFTQFDLHAYLEELLGRELEREEKIRATKIAEEHLTIKEVQKDNERKTKVYIFIF